MQRGNDKFVIDEILRLNLTLKVLIKVNVRCLYLHIKHLSDITDIDGKTIIKIF